MKDTSINCFTILPPFAQRGELFSCRIGGVNNPILQVTWNHKKPIHVSLSPTEITLAKEKISCGDFQNQLNVTLTGIVRAGDAALCELALSVHTHLFAWVSCKALNDLKLEKGAPAVAHFRAASIQRVMK
ncbi:MAG: hypothetical protein PQJ59_03555 [Spirochaetales bacterium]|nr:hypothetical protein [Spirochaetales bacterium]